MVLLIFHSDLVSTQFIALFVCRKAEKVKHNNKDTKKLFALRIDRSRSTETFSSSQQVVHKFTESVWLAINRLIRSRALSPFTFTTQIHQSLFLPSVSPGRPPHRHHHTSLLFLHNFYDVFSSLFLFFFILYMKDVKSNQ